MKNKKSNFVKPSDNPIPKENQKKYYLLAEKAFKENPKRKTINISTENPKIYFRAEAFDKFLYTGFYYKKKKKMRSVS